MSKTAAIRTGNLSKGLDLMFTMSCVGVVFSSSRHPSLRRKKSNGVRILTPRDVYGRGVILPTPRQLHPHLTPAHSPANLATHHFSTGLMAASAHKRCGAHDAAFREYERLLNQSRDPSQRIECKPTIWSTIS